MRAVNASFPSETLQQEAQAPWKDRSVQHPAQQCHPHPKTRHQEETHAPRASLCTDPVVTQLSLCQPVFPSCPKIFLLYINIGIRVCPLRQRSSSATHVAEDVPSSNSATHHNKRSF